MKILFGIIRYFIAKIPFVRHYSTKGHQVFWLRENREVYWENYAKTWKHPHRNIISKILSFFPWFSLIEIGCGSAPNLINIIQHFPGKQLGGIDINPVALQVANKQLQGALFKVGSGDDMLMSDKSSDVLLYDMFLIYVGPFKIKKYLEEAKRIARNYIVLCEFHNESLWNRLQLRIFSGKHAYNYKKLLGKMGFYDIILYKMPILEKDNDQKFRYIITARVPKK